jgi:adenylate cyclase
VGFVVAAFFVSLGWRASQERQRRNEVTGLFSRYVPASVARDLLESGSLEDTLAGRRVEVTVLFCDLRDFTALSAQLDPTEVRAMLDRYYEYASRLVLDHHGTLMQFVGDEVFAIFGAPIEDQRHAEHGLACAVALQREQDRLLDELEARGLPRVSFGIGLNSGDVVAAHVGSSIRRQYSVTGYAVNVGARLCSVAKPGEILLSDTFRTQAGELPPLEHTGALDLKGVSDDYRAWRVDPGALAPAVGPASS